MPRTVQIRTCDLREAGTRTITTASLSEELHVGTVRTCADAGLVEVARPSLHRVVMRLDL